LVLGRGALLCWWFVRGRWVGVVVGVVGRGSWSWVVGPGWSVVGRGSWVLGGCQSSVVDEVVGRRLSVVGRWLLVVSWIVGHGS